MTSVTERFIKYVKFDTASVEESTAVPSTDNQIVFAKELAQELKSIGLKNVFLSDEGYLYALLPSNTNKNLPTIGFIAHMDTSPDMSGLNVKPQIVKNYDGKNIILNKEENIILSPMDFPSLNSYIGEDLITTDGTTLLGADDKAGVAAIVNAMEYLINNPEINHGNISIAFTPDEEIGRGADYFDVERFNAEFAYTIDAGPIGELEYESFNASDVKLTITGRNTHPGYGKGKMINSMLIAYEFINSFPADERPENTEGYEGYFHLNTIRGNVENTYVRFLVRDFEKESFEKRKEMVLSAIAKLQKKYPEAIIELNMKDMYYNMIEKLKETPHIFETAKRALIELDIEPVIRPIRGGTDGSRLSFMGLPTPNLFGGGENFHSKYEYIPINSLNKSVEVILKIIELYTEK